MPYNKIKPHFLPFLIAVIMCLANGYNTYGDTLSKYDFSVQIKSTTDSAYLENLLDSFTKRGGFTTYQKTDLLNKLFERSQVLKLELLSAKCMHFLSIQKTLEGDFTSAFELEKLALPIFEKYNSSMVVEVYNSTGSMLADLGSTAEGIKNLKKAIQLSQQFKEDTANYNYLTINNYLVLGNIYYQDNQLSLSKEMFQIADSISSIHVHETLREKCYSLLNLANIDMKEGQYKNSLRKSDEALHLATKRNYTEIQAYCNYKTAQAFQLLNQLDSSILYADKMEKTAIKHKFDIIQNTAILLKGNIYQQFNLHKKSALEFQRYIKAKAKFDANNSKAISNYFTHLAEKEAKINSALELEQVKQKQKTRQLKFSILFGGIFLLLAIGFIYWFQRRKLKEQIRKEQIEKQLLGSQITAIRSQMNPHFIFNCLNSIQSLVLKKEVESTYDYISKFAFLVRSVLQQSNAEMIPLEEEIATLKLYLELEELRFNNDFTYQINQGPTDAIEIPPLLIQPFVENAIKHGLMHKDGEKTLEISLEQMENKLICIIEDNGIGRKESAAIKERQKVKHKSFSTASTNTRFELMQNRLDMHDLGIDFEDLMDAEGKPLGTKVKLTIPCKVLY